MRISDWSSDVCSSDLAWIGWRALRGLPGARRPHFVTTVHGLNSPSRYSAVMTRGERVICVSETVRDYVLQQYPRTDPTKLGVENGRAAGKERVCEEVEITVGGV